ncbi:replication-relaxation family protein [Bacillus thuringiensis]|uniref:replication-relaxation family protein n=1 Tax=Bacillus cereus group TaxID=86661 RepID=UPI000BA1E9C0|nr:replication-relaxation family protein [Bacillus thuringiensis]
MGNILFQITDEQLLMSLHTHIYLDIEYIHQKVYVDYTKKSVTNRLYKLEQAGYIRYEYLPVTSPRNQNRKFAKPQRIYTLTPKGVDMVRGFRGEVHWKASWSQRAASFVYHSLMLAKVECAMTLASKQEERLELKEWINEPRATFQYTKGRNRVIRPDGVAVIGLKEAIDKNIGVYMEMERSYGSKEVLEKKIIRYNDFMTREEKRKEYRAHAGIAYEVPIWRLVFVAGSESREKELIRYLKGVSSPEIPVFITLFQDILQDPFGSIYRNIQNSEKKVRL